MAKTFNSWWLSLKEEEQKVIMEDKWMMAGRAFREGKKADFEFYVIKHSDGLFSVQTKPEGGAIMLKAPFDARSEREATIACEAANIALKMMAD